METLFLICASLGGSLLVLQFLLGLLGIGHGELDQGLDGDVSSLDISHDFSGHDFAGHLSADPAAAGTHDAGLHPSAQDSQSLHHAAGQQARSVQFFKVLTFRSVVAALVFFGLAGMAAESAELESPQPLVIALAAGAAAMYGVYWLMQMLAHLRSDGTERIQSAVGREAIVYLGIPAARSGLGKITLSMQNRSLEYDAVTAGEALATGSRAVVLKIVGPGTVEVAAPNNNLKSNRSSSERIVL